MQTVLEIVLKINLKCAKSKQNKPRGRRKKYKTGQERHLLLAGKEFSPLSSLFSDAPLATRGFWDGEKEEMGLDATADKLKHSAIHLATIQFNCRTSITFKASITQELQNI